MAEDPKFLLHFKTLKKFQEKLNDGTVSENRHLVFIKDAQLIWCKGKYYADYNRFEDLSDYYNDWEVTQTSGNNLKIKLKGKEWTVSETETDMSKRVWKDISKEITLKDATQSVAGLQSAADKLKEDRITGTNHTISNPSSTTTDRKIKLTAINPTNNADASSEITIPSATQTIAGWQSAADKIKEDRITGTNYSISTPSATETTRNIKITGINPTDGSTVSSNVDIPQVTSTAAGVMGTSDYTQIYTTLPNAISTESSNRATAITNAINALDSNKTSTDGTNVQVKVTETDGKITAVNITTDNTINNTNLTNAINALDATVSGNSTSGHVSVSVTETDGKLSSITVSDSDIASASTVSTMKTKLDGIDSGANKYSLPLAASNTRGGVKTGYTANGKNYPVQLSNEQMYVNIPWTDTNTWPGTNYTTSNKNYAVKLDSSNNMYVNVPWTDTTTYLSSSGQAGPMLTGTSKPNETTFRMYDQHKDLGSTGYPWNYSTLLRFGARSAYNELAFEYTSTSGATRIHYRPKSDNDASAWGSWQTIAYLSDIPDMSYYYDVSEIDDMIDELKQTPYLKVHNSSDTMYNVDGISFSPVKVGSEYKGIEITCLEKNDTCLSLPFDYLSLSGGQTIRDSITFASGKGIKSATYDGQSEDEVTKYQVYNAVGGITDLRYSKYLYEERVDVTPTSGTSVTKKIYTTNNSSGNFQGFLSIRCSDSSNFYKYLVQFTHDDLNQTHIVSTLLGDVKYKLLKSSNDISINIQLPADRSKFSIISSVKQR